MTSIHALKTGVGQRLAALALAYELIEICGHILEIEEALTALGVGWPNANECLSEARMMLDRAGDCLVSGEDGPEALAEACAQFGIAVVGIHVSGASATSAPASAPANVGQPGQAPPAYDDMSWLADIDCPGLRE